MKSLYKYANSEPADSGPLLQQLLYACALRAGMEKTEPSDFDWPSFRRKLRPHKARGPSPFKHTAEEHAAAVARRKRWNKRWKQENADQINHAARVRYWKNPAEARAKANTILKRWPSDPKNRLESSERLARRNQKNAARLNHHRELRHLSAIYSMSLQELENPSYKIITPAGAMLSENWPLHDEAARIIAEAESLMIHTTIAIANAAALGVPAPERQSAGVPDFHGHQAPTVVRCPHVDEALPRTPTPSV